MNADAAKPRWRVYILPAYGPICEYELLGHVMKLSYHWGTVTIKSIPLELNSFSNCGHQDLFKRRFIDPWCKKGSRMKVDRCMLILKRGETYLFDEVLKRIENNQWPFVTKGVSFNEHTVCVEGSPTRSTKEQFYERSHIWTGVVMLKTLKFVQVLSAKRIICTDALPDWKRNCSQLLTGCFR